MNKITFLAILLSGAMAHAYGVTLDATDATPQYGRLAAAGVTASAVGSCNILVTLTANRHNLLLINSLNQDVSIAYNGVETFRLEAGESFALDLRMANFRFRTGKTLCVYHNGVAPTTGSIRATLF